MCECACVRIAAYLRAYSNRTRRTCKETHRDTTTALLGFIISIIYNTTLHPLKFIYVTTIRRDTSPFGIATPRPYTSHLHVSHTHNVILLQIAIITFSMYDIETLEFAFSVHLAAVCSVTRTRRRRSLAARVETAGSTCVTESVTSTRAKTAATRRRAKRYLRTACAIAITYRVFVNQENSALPNLALTLALTLTLN